MLTRLILIAALYFSMTHNAVSHPQSPPEATSQEEKRDGLVVRANGGEIIRQTDKGTETIKIPPEASPQLGMATSHFKAPGLKIGLHQHLEDDEAFFVHRGAGTFTLGNRKVEISEGDIVFIPKGTWHGFENKGTDTFLVWTISSSKYLELHRMFFSVGKKPPPAEVERLYIKYGFREKEEN